MNSVSSVRLTIPKAAAGEIARQGLIDKVLGSQTKFTYIHAGAGYGKTTLLSQIANASNKPVWLSLAGENDIFTFVKTLTEAMRQTFPDYDFVVSEYLPFIEKENFTIIVSNALIVSMEKLGEDFLLTLDDLHTIKNVQIKELIACLVKYRPESIRLCMGSREAPWQEFMPFSLRGDILEIRRNDLAFTKEEAFDILGFADANIYHLTEGWPLAIGSFRVLLENGVSFTDIPSSGKKALYSYLLYECISRLSAEMVTFLKASACFDELDAQMLDTVLNKKNSKLILESLVSRNMFTIKTGSGHFRYHALFRNGLLEAADAAQGITLQKKAVLYYCGKKEYSRAADYALRLKDKELLCEIILASYKDLMKSGNFSVLRVWFQELGDELNASGPAILVAKGAFLSSIGNFTKAKACLDAAVPLLRDDDRELYFEAMVHKARVLRNFVSFEESNKLLDELMAKLSGTVSETAYAVAIEKLYNLCWNSQINEAYALSYHMIEECAREGNLRIKAWFERYLSAVHFFAGRMKDSVYYYEKSLEIPEIERQYLDMHGIGIYAAKAYQMLGNQDCPLALLSEELQKLRSTGKYEEMWSGYLFAAEIHYQNTSIDRINGASVTYETTMKYFTLADEYAPLYRKTDFQIQWAQMQRLTYSLIFTKEPKEAIINEIFTKLDKAGVYLKSIILARLLGYFAAVSDFPRAINCAKQCIEIGESSNMLLHSTVAYGMLVRAAIAGENQADAVHYTKRYLRLCYDNGILAYFKARKDYDPILEFACDNGIEPDITKQIAEFAGYKTKKAYVKTFGGFEVFPYKSRENPLKMRTRRERELLALLLDAGETGLTKEQIYDAIWSESESENIKRLIGVNLTQIKKDLSGLGIENSVVCHGKHYAICMDEIECDFELFENAADEFRKTSNRADGLKLLNLYQGEYLSDFEAFWATAKRINYLKSYENAVKSLGNGNK